MYSCGMVGHSEYSLMPKQHVSTVPLNRARYSELSHTLSQLRILKDVERSELPRIHALKAQNLNRRPGETALWHLRSALHEQDNRCRGDGLVDGRAHFL
jgi:hypothetical protein